MKAIANRCVVSLKAKPYDMSPLSDEVQYGMVVTILRETLSTEDEEKIPAEYKNSDQNREWVYVRTHYRYEGYCRKSDLYFTNTDEWEAKELHAVTKLFADVLAEPRVQGACLQTIPRGGYLSVVGEVKDREGWLLVELADGTRGYTKASFLGTLYTRPFTEDEETFRQQVVQNALDYMGVQYRWGGKTPLGIDCSGLTSMSYMLCGVFTYRDASIVEGYPVHEISFEDKKPGDLLYFPGHIAMYIGDDKYVHATGHNGSDGVVINSLNPNDADYRQDLVDILQKTGSIFPLSD